MEKQESKSIQEPKETDQSKLTCGIIMPISSIDNCTKEHWVEVKKIILEAIQAANFTPSLVSDADDSGVIQKRIVQNIYDNDIVVCDVSCKNPNVMFELGMRLAFDKPTIIVMDDNTNYSFDTSVIEHLSYPRNLSYYQILDFQKKLSNKLNDKIYYNHSGYTGGLRERTAKVMKEQYPEEMIERAVKGMLPKGRLGRSTYKKLFVYAGSEHPHMAQKPVKMD